MVISHFINVSIEILIYFLVSILCLFIGRKVLDWITPYDLNNQTSIEKNLAAGITEAGFYIAMAIIVHASVSISLFKSKGVTQSSERRPKLRQIKPSSK